MRLVVIGYHDRICERLSNELVLIVLEREDDLETHLLILMSAITSNPHRQLN